VLKAGLIEFNPPLPQWKVDSYNQIEMANYVKIFCIFNTRWWDSSEYIFVANQRKGTYPMWKPIKSDCGQNLVFTVVTGDESRRVERTDPEQIKNEICAHLTSVYGHKFSAD
jgi:polyamine oxidase